MVEAIFVDEIKLVAEVETWYFNHVNTREKFKAYTAKYLSIKMLIAGQIRKRIRRKPISIKMWNKKASC